MRVLAFLLAASMLAWNGCSRADNLHSKDAVKAAIAAHLQQRSNVVFSNMTLEVQDVKFSGDTAVAQATFHSKRSPEIFVGVNYKLRRVGDHWVVDVSTPAAGMGANPHGAEGSTQPLAPTPQSSH
jgi:hypothetical protein